MSQTYGNVDGSADPAGAVAWQARMATWPGVIAYKQRTHDLLAGAAPTLDVGCGPGVDLAALNQPSASGRRAVGVDTSEAMASAAAAHGAVARGDAHGLPFGDEVFGGARADRVLQHMADPQRVLAEMARVVRRGGVVVVADPDQETLVIEVPGVRRSVLARLKALRRDVGYRNGALASSLPARMAELRLAEVTVDAYPLVIRRPEDAFGLPTWPAAWRREGRFTDEELAEWHAALDRPADGFLYVVTVLVVAGTVT